MALAALVPVLVLVGTAAADSGRSGPPPGSGKPAPAAPRTATATPAFDDIISFAQKRFPRQFTGASIDGRTLVIHRVPGDTMDNAVSRRFPNEPVRFADTPRSAAQLDTLARRVVADFGYWRARGVTIIRVGPDITRGVLVVGTPQARTAAPGIRARYGDAVIVERDDNRAHFV